MPLSDYDALFDAAGKKYNVDPAILRSIAAIESSGNPKAVSKAGAAGIMGIMPQNFAPYGVTDPTDPAQSIDAGAHIYSENLTNYGNPEDALRAYNAGNPTRWNNPETLAYVPKIISAFRNFAMPSAQAAEAKPGAASPQAPAGGAGDDAFSAAFGAPASAPPAADGVPTVTVTAAAPKAGDAGHTPEVEAALARAATNSAASQAGDAFSAAFKAPPQPQAATPATAPVAAVPAAAPPPPAGDEAPSYTADGIPLMVPSQYGAIGAGLGRTLHDVTDAPAELLARGGNALANTIGIGSQSGSDLATTDANARAQFNQQYGSNPLAQGVRIAGDIAATALPVGAVGQAVNLGGKAALGSNLLARAATAIGAGAAQGATGAALTAGSSDAPVGAQVTQGALTGGALGAAAPFAAKAADYLGNVARNAWSFLVPTETATNRLADAVVDRFAGGPVSANARQIVPGSVPTLAEAAANPGVTRLQNGLSDADPNINNLLQARKQANTAARGAALEGATGTQADLQTALTQRSAITPGAVFANKQPTSVQPVMDEIDSILKGPGGGRTAVQQALGKLRGALTDSDGNLLPSASDPEYLYHSVRKQIGDQLDSSNLQDASGRQAASELLQVRDKIDTAIEQGAPGFAQFRSDYSQASRPIDAMKWLQAQNLTDQQGNVTLAKIQNSIRNLNKQTSVTATGTNDAASVTPSQRATLEAIRDDLLRGQNVNLSKSIGSNTVKNLATQQVINQALPGPLSIVSKAADPRFIGAGLGYLTGHGFAGEAIGGALGQAFKTFAEGRNAAVQNRLAQVMLDPSLYTPTSVVRLGNPLLQLQPYLPASGAIVQKALPSQKGP